MGNNRLILRNLNSPWVVPTTDITKNSVLSWADLDNNFIYLKGELINSSELDGEELILNKINGNNINVDLSDLVTPLNNNINYISGQTVTSISFDQNNYDLSIVSNNGVLDTINLGILSQDIFVTGGTYDNSSGVVTFNKNNGDSFDIPGFITGFTDFYTTGATLNGTVIEFDRTDLTNAYSVDITSINSDNFVTGGTYNSLTESIDFSGTSSATTFSVNVSDLLDDTNTFTTGATLNGTVIEFDRTDLTNAYSVDISNLGWTGGTNYILVKAEGTDIQNAAELQAAYDLATSMSATSTNRITIVAAPGYYNFGSGTFTMDTQYIDLVSLDGNRSIIFNAALNTLNRLQGSISVLSNNTLVKGVNVLTKSFKVGNNLNNLIIENCEGGERSFGYIDFGENFTLSGTFINCKAGNTSFGVRPLTNLGASTLTLTISGMFIDCESGTNSFGANSTTLQETTLIITGQFINCKSGERSFGSAFNAGSNTTITISGAKFINCESTGRYSFGHSRVNNVSNVTINNSTVFENCKSFNNSFGSKETSGVTTNITLNQVTFKDCVAYQFGVFPLGPGDNSFGYFSTLSNSDIINCIARDNSFGLLVSGCNFENCKARDNSFGSNTGGTFKNCEARNNSFGSGEENVTNGVFIDCTAGNNSFGSGTDSFTMGEFTNCIGGENSFGGNGGTLTAKLYQCRLKTGTFQAPTGSGKVILGIDGNDNIINLTA